MKLYFLVEGISSEMQVYPEWIKYFIPSVDYIDDFETFKNSKTGFFLISGEGYPSILNHLENSVKDIVEIGDVAHFFVILDSDESSIADRETEVLAAISVFNLNVNSEITVVVQKRCFETILLGNKLAIPRQTNNHDLMNYISYYNVVSNDPELMGPYSNGDTHSQFHAKYAIKALRERRIRYSKSRCSGVANNQYIDQIVKRIDSTGHLQSFKKFSDKLIAINQQLP